MREIFFFAISFFNKISLELKPKDYLISIIDLDFIISIIDRIDLKKNFE